MISWSLIFLPSSKTCSMFYFLCFHFLMKALLLKSLGQQCTLIYLISADNQFIVLCILQWISLFKGPSFCNMLKSKTSLREAGKGYIPQCEGDNGTFSPMQCSQDEGRCWCVFDNGEEVPGTRVSGGRPACASEFLLEALCCWANPALELDLHPNFFQYLGIFNLCSDICRDFCSSSLLCVIADFRHTWAQCPVFSKCFVKEKGKGSLIFALFIKLVKSKLESQSEQLAANLNLFQPELALGLKSIQLTKIKFEKCMLLLFLFLACDQSCEKDVPKRYIFTEYFLHDQNCEALEFTHGFQ